MVPPARELLDTWERGRTRHPLDRALLLYALATRDAPPASLADEPLGRRNVALLRFRQAAFGRQLHAFTDCPACAQRLEFELDVGDLYDPDAPIEKAIRFDGRQFRLPTTRDLASIVQETDVDDASMALLRSCLVADPDGPGDNAPLPAIDLVEAALEAADPVADIVLDFSCEACDCSWQAPLDVPGFLWEELETQAARLLDEVHLLASAYGWSEAEILAMPDARRGAYLERVLA
jgi:hypothetical protein